MSAASVGTVASVDVGVVRVEADAGQVKVTHRAALALSPALARELGNLLVRAADVAECSACGGSGVVARGDRGQPVPPRPCRECSKGGK